MLIILKGLIILSYGFMLVINVLANSLPLGGNTTGAISDKYPTLFTPTGFTFSIWGLIYVMLGILTYQLISKPADEFTQTLTLFAVMIILSSVLNGLWLIAWHNDYILTSSIVMVFLLLSLIASFLLSQNLSKLFQGTTGLYLGWVSVALIANISITFISYQMIPFGISEVVWLFIVVFVGIFIALLTLLRTGNIVYTLVFIWAFFGIFMRHFRSGDAHAQPISILMVVAMITLIIASFYQYINNDYQLL